MKPARGGWILCVGGHLANLFLLRCTQPLWDNKNDKKHLALEGWNETFLKRPGYISTQSESCCYLLLYTSPPWLLVTGNSEKRDATVHDNLITGQYNMHAWHKCNGAAIVHGKGDANKKNTWTQQFPPLARNPRATSLPPQRSCALKCLPVV